MEIVKKFITRSMWLVFIYIFWAPIGIILSNIDLFISVGFVIGFIYFTELTMDWFVSFY
jgi:hypothetical protein